VHAGDAVAALDVGEQGAHGRQPARGVGFVQRAGLAHLVDGAARDVGALEAAQVSQLQRKRLLFEARHVKAGPCPQARVVDLEAPHAQPGAGQCLFLGQGGRHRRRRCAAPVLATAGRALASKSGHRPAHDGVS
jgi:hypothetical protein